MKLIVATDSTFGIAAAGTIPWIDTAAGREDLAYFRSWTHGNDVIMGRATWESLPRRPLPGRRNIVLTSAATSATPTPTSTSVLSTAPTFTYETASSLTWITDGWVIGGAQTYREALASGRATMLYLTYIGRDWGCDVHFPMDMLFTLYRTQCVSNTAIKYDDCTVYRMVIALTYVSPAPDAGIAALADEPGYLQLLHEVMTTGELRATRNAVTRSLFARSLTFGLSRFPLLTTKTVFLRGVFEELMMFIRGETDTRCLSAAGVRIWEPNTSAEFLAAAGLPYPVGFMGPMYGYNWRHFGRPYVCGAGVVGLPAPAGATVPTSGFDQLAACMDLIARDPASRRIIMTTFDPSVAAAGVLYPCHGISVQFHVSTGRYLSCAMTQRSADIFLGLPFNIASYALLVYLLCAHLNAKHAWTGSNALRPGRLTINCGDVHLYESHIDAAQLQLLRAPGGQAPQLAITAVHDRIEDYVWSDIALTEYVSYGRIAADMVA